MPGYDSQVIMAAGAFIQGSSIELSADGPLKEPYAVYFQGGLTWYHAKYGIMMSLQKIYETGKTGSGRYCHFIRNFRMSEQELSAFDIRIC